MSDQNRLDELARRTEQDLLAAITDYDRRAILDRFKADAQRALTDMFAEVKRTAPFLEYIWKLRQRQGTITPDFDALYRKKAELDRNLNDPRP